MSLKRRTKCQEEVNMTQTDALASVNIFLFVSVVSFLKGESETLLKT